MNVILCGYDIRFRVKITDVLGVRKQILMTQYDSHLGPKTGRKLCKVTNIHDAKWQSSWTQDETQVGLARTIEFGCQDTLLCLLYAVNPLSCQ